MGGRVVEDGKKNN